MEKNHIKAKEMLLLTTEYSYDTPNKLFLFGFTCCQVKISRNLKKNVLEEAYWVGVAILLFTPCNAISYQGRF